MVDTSMADPDNQPTLYSTSNGKAQERMGLATTPTKGGSGGSSVGFSPSTPNNGSASTATPQRSGLRGRMSALGASMSVKSIRRTRLASATTPNGQAAAASSSSTSVLMTEGNNSGGGGGGGGEAGRGNVDGGWAGRAAPKERQLLWVPKCICLLSHYPFFKSFRRFLCQVGQGVMLT